MWDADHLVDLDHRAVLDGGVEVCITREDDLGHNPITVHEVNSVQGVEPADVAPHELFGLGDLEDGTRHQNRVVGMVHKTGTDIGGESNVGHDCR